MTSSPEWDDDGSEVTIEQNETEGLMGWGSPVGASGVSGYSGSGYSVDDLDAMRINHPLYTMQDNGIISDGVVGVTTTNTTLSWDASPMMRTEIHDPITYDCSEASWKHTFTVALNILIGPFLCILSKLLRKKIGI